MGRLAIIGGTGALTIVPRETCSEHATTTPFGAPSGPILEWLSGDTHLCFIPRHGPSSTIPPHRVNYRANLWALRERQVDRVIGINAVGGITADARPGWLVFPDQIIDYTWGRDHTFNDTTDEPVQHVDFTAPFAGELRAELVEHSRRLGLHHLDRGTCGVTQGPRLETAAEVDRLERDGCHVVGMTAMPEAVLARELALDYAVCAVVVNPAAGRTARDLHEEIARYVDLGMAQVRKLLAALVRA